MREIKTEKPILFNTEMVKAILEGRKTTTRRPTEFKPYTSLNETKGDFEICEPVTQNFFKCRVDFERWAISKCRYQVSDTLWVRETWNKFTICEKYNPKKELSCSYIYKASSVYPEGVSWKPSIHMPRTAARIFLKVTDVRVERLQDITEDGAKTEGTKHSLYSYKTEFQWLWNSIYHNWNENPWVWVIEFERMV